MYSNLKLKKKKKRSLGSKHPDGFLEMTAHFVLLANIQNLICQTAYTVYKQPSLGNDFLCRSAGLGMPRVHESAWLISRKS